MRNLLTETRGEPPFPATGEGPSSTENPAQPQNKQTNETFLKEQYNIINYSHH